MGMYTGIRFKGIIKEEFAPVINTMMEQRLDWIELYEKYPKYEFLMKFSDGFRPDFIPYGSLSYMPDEWENVPQKEDSSRDWKNATATDGFERLFNPENREWKFQCSLKNYENDIERFFDLVLPQIVEKIDHLEYYYEEWARSVFYELVDGKVVQSNKEGILYGYEETPSTWGY